MFAVRAAAASDDLASSCRTRGWATRVPGYRAATLCRAQSGSAVSVPHMSLEGYNGLQAEIIHAAGRTGLGHLLEAQTLVLAAAGCVLVVRGRSRQCHNLRGWRALTAPSVQDLGTVFCVSSKL